MDETPNKDFLGTGWSFPPTFSRATLSVDMVRDEQDIRESLEVLFSTALGERIMLPEYGCNIWLRVFQSVNRAVMRQLENDILNAILNGEPRITVDAVNIEPDANQAGRLLIMVDYTIRKTNTRSNFVYPFYVDEATIPAPTP